jgi:hypothetical protein
MVSLSLIAIAGDASIEANELCAHPFRLMEIYHTIE